MEITAAIHAANVTVSINTVAYERKILHLVLVKRTLFLVAWDNPGMYINWYQMYTSGIQ